MTPEIEPKPEKKVVILPFFPIGQLALVALAWSTFLYGEPGRNANAHLQ